MKEALKVVAEEMKRGPKDCLDKTLGKLIGVDETVTDTEADTAWEESRR